jgi:hypothetical protein
LGKWVFALLGVFSDFVYLALSLGLRVFEWAFVLKVPQTLTIKALYLGLWTVFQWAPLQLKHCTALVVVLLEFAKVFVKVCSAASFGAAGVIVVFVWSGIQPKVLR